MSEEVREGGCRVEGEIPGPLRDCQSKHSEDSVLYRRTEVRPRTTLLVSFIILRKKFNGILIKFKLSHRKLNKF